MSYPAKVLINRTGKKVEFFYDGKPQIFEIGEKRPVDGVIAYHALYQVNTKLEEYNESMEVKEPKSLSEMPWKELVSLASKKGFFKPGLSRKEVEEKLKLL